jgi:hypothetical protein
VASNAAVGFLLPRSAKTREHWERLDRAHAILDAAEGAEGKRRAVLRELEQAVEMWWFQHPISRAFLAGALKAGTAAELRVTQQQVVIPTETIEKLTMIVDAFGGLEIADVAALLKKTRPSKHVTKGGAGRTGVVRLAARLSVKVRAFGDQSEELSRKRYLAASSDAAHRSKPARRRASPRTKR